MRRSILLLLALSPSLSALCASSRPVIPIPSTARALKQKWPQLQRLDDADVENFMIECGGWKLWCDRLPGVSDEGYVNFAKPFSGGPIRVLVVGHTGFGTEYMIQQLADRLDGTVNSLLFFPPGGRQPYTPDWERVVVARAEEVLARPVDVIVATPETRPYTHIPRVVRTSIVQKVRGGTGLVSLVKHRNAWSKEFQTEADPLRELDAMDYKWYEEPPAPIVPTEHFLAQGIPFNLIGWPRYRLKSSLKPGAKAAASFGERPFIAAWEVGKGRVVGIAANGFPLAHWVGPEYYESETRSEELYFSMLLKAIVWAASRTPTVALRVPRDLSHTQGQATPWSFAVANAGSKPASLVLDAQTRDGRWRELSAQSQEMTLPPGKSQTVALTLDPWLPMGTCLVDIRARRDGKIADWATVPVTVTGSLAVEVTTDKQVYGTSDTLAAQATVRNAPTDSRLTLFVEDTLGRRLKTAKTKRASASLAVELVEQPGIVLHAVAQVHDRDDHMLAEERRAVTVPRFAFDDYHNILWTGLSGWGPVWESLLKTPRDFGITALLGMAHGEQNAKMWAAHTYANYPQTVTNNLSELVRHFPKGKDGDEWSRPPLSDAMAQLAAKRLDTLAPYFKAFGALNVYLSDEALCRFESDFSDSTLAAFRNHLKGRYGTLAELNRVWDTDFGDWQQVQPLKERDVTSRDNVAPWLEHRMFMDAIVAKEAGRFADELRDRVGRDIPIGLEGTFGFQPHIIPYGALNWGRLADAGLNGWGCYSHAEISCKPWGHVAHWEIMRSLTSGPNVSIQGYEYPREWHFLHPWWVALHGGHGMIWFYGPVFMTGTGAVTSRAQWIDDATRELRQGVGKLLLSAERDRSPIYLLYDHTSCEANYILGRRKEHRLYAPYTHSRYAFQRAIQDCGFACEYTTPERIEKGGPKGARLLILTGALRMSAATVERVRSFVRAGGAVVADMGTALLDDAGRPYAKFPLEGVFGLRRTHSAYELSARSFKLGVTRPTGDFPLPKNVWLTPTTWEKGLEVTTGTALGQHFETAEGTEPAFVHHRCGDGQALYLNFTFDRYLHGFEAGYREIVRHTLRNLGLAPRARVCDADGSTLPHYDINTFASSDAKYVGIIRRGLPGVPNAGPKTVHLGAPGYVYDVRAGRLLGHTDQVERRFDCWDVALYAVMPYRLVALRLEAEVSQQRLAVAVSFDRTPAAESRVPHIVRVELADPRGHKPSHYQRNVVLTPETGRIAMPLAENDLPGLWRVTVRDVATGVSADATFESDTP